MNMHISLYLILAIVLCVLGIATLPKPARAATLEPITLWPNGAPGDDGKLGPEHDSTRPTDGEPGGKRVTRTADVSVPTLTVYAPPSDKKNGTAVLVCPGGGYNILAFDLEGSEICEWLNSIGVTAILLKYRVPRRPGREPYAAPLQDAQRAMGIVRNHAAEWGIKPDRIGVLGFSAGGHLSAALSTNYETRTYPGIDTADSVSCRPDFVVLVYPAYLTQPAAEPGDIGKVSPDLKITAQTPPTFITQTEDDKLVEGSVGYYVGLRNAHVPVEMHLYPKGGHGYGLRPSEKAPIADAWPRLVEAWMRVDGLL